jgi:hypothetical protein
MYPKFQQMAAKAAELPHRKGGYSVGTMRKEEAAFLRSPAPRGTSAPANAPCEREARPG